MSCRRKCGCKWRYVDAPTVTKRCKPAIAVQQVSVAGVAKSSLARQDAGSAATDCAGVAWTPKHHWQRLQVHSSGTVVTVAKPVAKCAGRTKRGTDGVAGSNLSGAGLQLKFFLSGSRPLQQCRAQPHFAWCLERCYHAVRAWMKAASAWLLLLTNGCFLLGQWYFELKGTGRAGDS